MKANLPIGCWVLIALVVAVVFVLASCGSKPAIEGSYFRYSEHEAGREWDTLVIEAYGKDLYRITRKWRYERVLDGRRIEPEYKMLHSTGIYLGKEGLLLERDSGLRYKWDGKNLQVGETVYQKLK